MIAALLVAVAVALAALWSPPLVADERNRAGLVVRTNDGDVDEFCVFFDEDEISGADLLERADVEVTAEAAALGTAVCAIDGKGCSEDDCFCRYPTFWGYWTKDDGDWRFSDLGAADRVVRDGSVDGWSFGRDGKPSPPDLEIDDVCPASAKVTTAARSTPRAVEARPNYAGFVGFVALLGAAGLIASRIRRRPRRPSGT